MTKKAKECQKEIKLRSIDRGAFDCIDSRYRIFSKMGISHYPYEELYKSRNHGTNRI